MSRDDGDDGPVFVLAKTRPVQAGRVHSLRVARVVSTVVLTARFAFAVRRACWRRHMAQMMYDMDDAHNGRVQFYELCGWNRRTVVIPAEQDSGSAA